MYWDAKNLYGWSVSQKLQVNGLNEQKTLQDLIEITSKTTYK